MFQLTRPAGGEPDYCEVLRPFIPSFNSLAPRGANLVEHLMYNNIRKFQLTRPAGGEP